MGSEEQAVKRSISGIFAALLMSAAFFALSVPPNARAASMALLNTLVQIQQLSNHDFKSLVAWSKNWAPQPQYVYTPLQATENSIRKLPGDDRNAIFFWLDGLGRAALYARGVTDAQIGTRDPGSSSGSTPAPTPTPNPWRALSLVSGSLDQSTEGNITILGGFAAAKRDGRSVIACVSFMNVSTKTASDITFEFPLLSEGGNELGKLTLDRTGTFSPNVGIYSYNSMSDWLQMQPPSSRLQNCVRRDLGTAALPILEARLAGYRVVKVLYTDGSSWTP